MLVSVSTPVKNTRGLSRLSSVLFFRSNLLSNPTCPFYSPSLSSSCWSATAFIKHIQFRLYLLGCPIRLSSLRTGLFLLPPFSGASLTVWSTCDAPQVLGTDNREKRRKKGEGIQKPVSCFRSYRSNRKDVMCSTTVTDRPEHLLTHTAHRRLYSLSHSSLKLVFCSFSRFSWFTSYTLQSFSLFTLSSFCDIYYISSCLTKEVSTERSCLLQRL